MMLSVLGVGLGLLLAGGLAAALAGSSPGRATRFGVAGTVVGCATALVPALRVLATGSAESLRLPWAVPGGAFHVELDPLSAVFLLPVLVVSPLAALYGGAYLRAHAGGRSLGSPWLFFNVLVVAMALVVVARNAVLFLVAWEVMALASFFLVTLDDDRESVREAGWIYLIATHLGTAFLLARFVILGSGSGSLDFDGFGRGAGWTPAGASGVFALALVGFGTKAGLVPFHVWLPEAHPAAPSHVSAVMSGVMVKMGIYGLVLTRLWLGPPEAAWGWLLVGIGAVSALVGVLLALAQTDLKRMLAYSTVENVGIVALGLGLGAVAERSGHTQAALLGYGGALVHVLNHAVFKSLLFLGAGSVLHATGTVEMSRLGGLARWMPRTGLVFVVGAAAVSAVPALNGFPGEFLILLGAYSVPGTGLALAVIAPLALASGLAAATFTRAFGIAFLGEARSPGATRAHEVGVAMQFAPGALAAGCVLLGLAFPTVYSTVATAFAGSLAAAGGTARQARIEAPGGLDRLQVALVAFVVLAALAAAARRRIVAARPAGASATWGCGFARPTPRMQYTASSFARPLLALFAAVVPTFRAVQASAGLFPPSAAFATATPDPFRHALYAPAFRAVSRSLAWLRWLQHGRVQLYVLYIAVVLVALLVWGMGWLR
jgi:formate hydrogenlyase subunit 3/multisubunit Na+/H+ antiporter MnhD subunit